MHLPTFLHSVSYSGSWGQARLPLEQFIDKAADLGFDGVLLMAKRPHLSLLDYGPAERRELRTRIEKRALRVAVAGYNNFTADLEHGDIPNREIQVYNVIELARLTADLGGNLLRIFTAYEHPAATYHPQWSLVVDALRECARRTTEWGITIGVQNHHDIGVGCDSLYDLIREVNEPNCRAMFDAWAPALHGSDLEAAARKLAPLTAHTTIANYQRRPRYKYDSAAINYTPLTPYMQAVPIDEGFIDYAAFLGALDAGGFNGSVAYEMCSPLAGGSGIENLDAYASRFVGFLRTLRELPVRV